MAQRRTLRQAQGEAQRQDKKAQRLSGARRRKTGNEVPLPGEPVPYKREARGIVVNIRIVL